MSVPRVITEPLGGSALSLAAAAGMASAAWYARRPRSGDEWRRHVAAIRESANETSLDRLAAALGASGPAAERLRRVAGEGGVVITTGQQPGLFGGPVYTWAKAISALALADELEEMTGVPVAPVFWAATDDSDFAESSWTMIAVPGGAEELRLRDAAPAGRSMAHVPLGDVAPLLDRLEEGAGSAQWRVPLDAARQAYGPGQTVGSAYVALLRRLLEPLGIAILDAAHPAVRVAAVPVLRSALRSAPALAEQLSARSAALVGAGHRPQVAEIGSLSLVFRVDGGERRRIRVADAAAAAETAADDALSPNVLLRPVVERAMLPTAAYVAGPAELSYFAQSGAVADVLGLSRPLGVPRWSCTILEPRVEEILSRFDIDIAALRDPHAVETRLARAAIPPAVASTIARLRSEIDAATTALAAHEDPIVPPASVEGTRRTIEQRIQRLERRYAAAMKRRLARDLEQIATARGSLFPGGRRQERALNLLPVLARHGPALLEAMIARAREHAGTIVADRPTAISVAQRDARQSHTPAR